MRNYQKFGVVSLAFFAAVGVASAATLTLSPSSQTINVGDTLTVQVLLDTQGQPIDGVDINALNYNPYNLQMVQVQPGALMPNTVANSQDSTNGKIILSQITNGGSTYTGKGTLATVTFKALVAGTAKVTFDFTPGATTDSNVASQGNDILSSVVNGLFTINNAPGGGSNVGTGVGGGNSTGTALTGGNSNDSNSLAQLLALLNQLKAQLKALVLQAIARGIKLPPGLAESLGINPTTGVATGGTGGSTGASGGQFTRNLSLGSSGADVRALQQFLNSHGFVIVAIGPGSPGNEVLVFGLKTKVALIKFQAANGLPATGLFGPMTRAKVVGM